MRVPTILLERLKREFDDSNKQLGDQIKQKPGDSNTKKKKWFPINEIVNHLSLRVK